GPVAVFSKTARSRPRHGKARWYGDDLPTGPVRRGRFADEQVKGLAEGAKAREANVEADIGNASVGAAQQEERSLDAPALQIAVRCLAECPAKRPNEVSLGNVGDARERGNVKWLAIGEIHGVARTQQSPVRLLDCTGHRESGAFSGSDRAYPTPSSTHRCSCAVLRTPSGSTRNHPGISRLPITA